MDDKNNEKLARTVQLWLDIAAIISSIAVNYYSGKRIPIELLFFRFEHLFYNLSLYPGLTLKNATTNP